MDVDKSIYIGDAADIDWLLIEVFIVYDHLWFLHSIMKRIKYDLSFQSPTRKTQTIVFYVNVKEEFFF